MKHCQALHRARDKFVVSELQQMIGVYGIGLEDCIGEQRSAAPNGLNIYLLTLKSTHIACNLTKYRHQSVPTYMIIRSCVMTVQS